MFKNITKGVLDSLDYSVFNSYIDTSDNEFYGKVGKEHYRLLSYLSTKFDNSVIFDIGTHRGSSALALSYNSKNTIYTFDIVDKVSNVSIKEKENIRFIYDNLFEEDGRKRWKDMLLKAPFIFLDVDPHNGTMEIEFYTYLNEIGYQGFVVCDDIWYFKEMRNNFWYKLPYENRYDLTDVGHWSGTGVFTFNDSIEFDKRDNSDWTLFSAYFNLTRCCDASDEIKNRDQAYYMENAVSTMSLPYNLIVYCDAESLPLLTALRPSYLQDKTKYVIREFEELKTKDGRSFTELRECITKNRQKNPYYFDKRNTGSYYLFCMARYIIMKEVIEENYFNSKYFAWINICIERMGYMNVLRLDEALSVKRNKFSTCYIDYIPESLVKDTCEYYKWGRCSMCSGFFTGNKYYMYTVCDLIEEKFLKYLSLGYGHADEQLYSPVYFENKSLFDHYYGDYLQMITNYTYIYDAAEPPIYNFIRNSYKNGDYVKCKEACVYVMKSLELVKCECNQQLKQELYDTFKRV